MSARWAESDFVGGCLSLDFANTVDNRIEPAKYKDSLGSYADLVSWGLFAGVVSSDVADRLNDLASTDPRAVASAFNQALRLREAVYRAFAALSETQPPNDEDIEEICSAFAGAGRCLSLVPTDAGVEVHWRIDPDDALGVIAPIAYSANGLLLGDELADLKQCQGCGWLFLDTSKNGRRRWCDMKTCGNRAKARRHRQKKALAPTAPNNPPNDCNGSN